MKLIRAVAVGRSAVDIKFDASNTDVSAVRPYLQGVKDWLALAATAKAFPKTDTSSGQWKYVLGKDYEIEYRERDALVLQDAFSGADYADVLLCMSTGVGVEAIKWRHAQNPVLTTPPIVVITSDPSQFVGEEQVCGVSALRPQLANIGLDKFKEAKTNLKKIHILGRQHYGPSEQALKGLGGKKPPLELHYVKDNEDPSTVVANIRSSVPTQEAHGLFLLPADRFFGWAKEIQTEADKTGKAGSSLSTFWSTTDWPPNAFGGYGYPQNRCGRYMAERIASIWASSLKQVPDPAFLTIDPSEIAPKSVARRVRRSGRKKPARASSKKRKVRS
jgi:hypothetical protein